MSPKCLFPIGWLLEKGAYVAETPFEQEVERNFRWNFSVNLLDISFIMLGLSLVSRETVIPLLVSKLTPSPVAIGLVPAVYSLGIYLPQLIGASVAETMPRKKPFVALVGAVGERLPYLLSGLAVLLLAESAPTAALAVLALLFGISGAGAGIAIPAWFDMTALAPLLGGWLAAQFGYPPMFALAALLACLGAGLLAGWVHEPRWTKPMTKSIYEVA